MRVKLAGIPLPVTLPRTKKFTLAQVYAVNSGISDLTVYNRVKSMVRGYKLVDKKRVKVPKELVQLDEKVKQDGVGRPSFLFTKIENAVTPTVKATKVVKTRKTKTAVKVPSVLSVTIGTIPVTAVPVPTVEAVTVVAPLTVEPVIEPVIETIPVSAPVTTELTAVAA